MPEIYQFWMIFGIAFVVALIVTPFTVKLAHKAGILDVPDGNRRIHKRPIPRFGGLAIFAGIAVAMCVIAYLSRYDVYYFSKIIKVLIVGVFVYLLGVADDIYNLTPKIKLMGQIVAGAALYFLGIRLQIVSLFGTHMDAFPVKLITFILTVVWIIVISNTINLIDGVDGLAGGISFIASMCIAYVAYKNGYYITCFLMLACAGSAIGFLPFNFYPAKTFMGDGGSLFLGYSIAAYSIVQPVKSAAVMALLIPLIVLLLPLVDTMFAIFRRIINKKPIMSADKGHIHHRLMKAGMGQRRTVILMYCISAIMGISAILFSYNLYLECGGLILVSLVIIYVLLTDANRWTPRIRDNDEPESAAPIIITNNDDEYSKKNADNKDNNY